jgi:pimeloyl-ACP methyl ester carboxylesterase
MLHVAAMVALGWVAGAWTCAAADKPWLTVPDPPAMPKADRSGLAPVNDIQMYYAVFNQSGGDPVLLLHGGLVDSDSWGFEVPLLMKTHEVIVADSRGHGRSTRSAVPFSYALMTSDTIALMDFLKIEKASVVGWSDGGIIGMIMAIEHRERVNKLVTYGANFSHAGHRKDPPSEEFKALGARFMVRVEADYRSVSPTPREFLAFRAALRQMYQTEPALRPEALATIRAPTLVIAGEHEQFYTREHFETMAQLIPDARLVILPNASHGGPRQQPAAFHEIVAGFLDAPR